MTLEPPPTNPLDYQNPANHVTGPAGMSLGRILAWTFGILIAVALLISCLFPSLGRARETSNRVKCASCLKMLGSAAWLYADSHNGHLPPDLGALFLHYHQDLMPDIFVCPSSSLDKPTGTTVQQIHQSMLSGDHLSYVWTARGLTTATLTPDTVLAFDLEDHLPKDSAPNTGINVLLGDGSVTFVDEPTAKSLRAQHAAGIHPLRLPATTAPTTQPSNP